MAKAYSYERVSSRQQAVGGRGLERQSTAAETWCAARGLELDDTLDLTDPGRSAFHGDNVRDGALGKFLALAQAGQLGPKPLLLVEAIDRLSRLELLEAVQEVIFGLLRAGVEIHTLEDGQTYTANTVNNDIGKAILLIAKIHAAAEYSKRLSSRMRSSWDQAYADLDAGRLPRGSVFLPPWCERREDQISLLPQAATVRRIFAEALEQGSSVIARRLNRERIPTFSGRPEWTRASVETVLRDPRAYGAVRVNAQHNISQRKLKRSPRRQGAERTFMDLLPAAVTQEQFEAARAVIASRAAPTQRRGNVAEMLFVGQSLVHCRCGSTASCTSTYSGKQRTLRRYVRCRRRQDGGDHCGAVGYSLEALNAHVLTRLHRGQLQQMLAADTQRQSLVRAEHEAVVRLQGQLALALEQQANSAAMFKQALRAGRIDPLFQEAVDEARNEVAAAEKALAGARQRLSVLRQEVDSAEFDTAVADLFAAFAAGSDTAEQRQQVNTYLRRAGLTITLDNERRRVGLAIGDAEPIWQPFDPTISKVALTNTTTSATYRDLTITPAKAAALAALFPDDQGWAEWLHSMQGVPLTGVTSLPPGWESGELAKALKKTVAELPPDVREAFKGLSDLGGAPAVADAHVDLEGDL